MGIDLVRGRYFDERDHETAALAIIVDERLAQKFWPGQDPIGRRMRMPEDIKNLMAVSPQTRWFTVVGVVRSLRLDDMASVGDMVGAYYFPYAQAPRREFTLALKGEGETARWTRAVREELRRVDPELALYDIRTMAERGQLALDSRRTALLLAAGFGAVALFLAAIGVFGVLAYSVAERRREIGIRMALGSTREGIAWLVVREGVALVGVGLMLGAAGALAMRRAIEQQVFGVGTLDPAVWAGVMALFAVLAVAACGVPAMRAARVDPARVLSE
jgi:ABC-type lipoprotein release transport system permease subunit